MSNAMIYVSDDMLTCDNINDVIMSLNSEEPVVVIDLLQEFKNLANDMYDCNSKDISGYYKYKRTETYLEEFILNFTNSTTTKDKIIKDYYRQLKYCNQSHYKKSFTGYYLECPYKVVVSLLKVAFTSHGINLTQINDRTLSKSVRSNSVIFNNLDNINVNYKEQYDAVVHILNSDTKKGP